MRYYLSVGFTVLLITAAAVAVAAPVTLEYKFTPGEVDKYTMTADATLNPMNLPAGIESPELTRSLTWTRTQKTLAVNPDGSAKVQVVCGQPVAKGIPLDADEAKYVKSLANQPFILTLSKKGEVVSVENLDKLKAIANDADPGFAVVYDLNDWFSLPQEPVEPGKSWTDEDTTASGYGHISVKSTLDDLDRKIWNLTAARISQTVSGSLGVHRTNNPAGSQPPESAVDVSGSFAFYFAPSIGKLLKGNGSIQTKADEPVPADLVALGLPKTMTFILEYRVTITRFK